MHVSVMTTILHRYGCFFYLEVTVTVIIAQRLLWIEFPITRKQRKMVYRVHDFPSQTVPSLIKCSLTQGDVVTHQFAKYV